MKYLSSVLNDRKRRQTAMQLLFASVIILLAFYFAGNLKYNLTQQGNKFGFSFLSVEAGFAISESWISYNARSSYARALLVGLLNTLYVSFFAIVLTTILGTLIGIARTSKIWLIAKLSFIYVELFRNIPILLQVFFWSSVVRLLPPPRQALEISEGIYLSNRGILHPMPVFNRFFWIFILILLFSVFSIYFIRSLQRKAQENTGSTPPIYRQAIIVVSGAAILILLVVSRQWAWDVPLLEGFNFAGGVTHSPEFIAILTALVIYTSSYAAEIVRAGIESVDRGQIDAAKSLGLKETTILFRIILPQALRVIIPPMTTQYLNLLKDSSLGVAIGYPDLVNITNTTINQTGQAVELIAVLISVYLFLSLMISVATNLYNKKIVKKVQLR